ncbi:Zn-dependent protease [Pyrodictium delaneyi]|uniref:Zn-dependent protease n=1 Tax=Pyrodictium delaneyi TaxID=1273541 RepID=A0A0P0N5V5_9CREN|nr:M48 family metalloprotease [Pyrodictium delaneyi]ALL01823.1 Zn-dependent protease [Pyrodictium delaneyi]
MHPVLLTVGLAASALLPAAYVHAVKGGPRHVWLRLRLVMVMSVSALLLITASIGVVDKMSLALAAPALAGVYLVLNYHFERRSVNKLLYGLKGRVHSVTLLSSPVPAAFTVAMTGRVYATTELYRRLEPEEAAAIVAHEIGHLEALHPIPPPLFVTVIAIMASILAAGIIDLLGQGLASLVLVAVVLLMAGIAWVVFNWAWEHLADLYALDAAGAWSISALYRITGARPEEPRLLSVYLDAVKCLRPRGGRGVTVLVNPHPRPGYRLYLLEKIAWQGEGRGSAL